MSRPDQFFISLKTSPERTQSFLNFNNHVPGVHLFYGVNGKELLSKGNLSKDLVDDTCLWPDSSIGSGLSHTLLWLKAIHLNKPVTIFENDAFLCANFQQEHQRILKTLPPDWDIILWGYNADTTLQFKIVPGLRESTSQFDQSKIRKVISNFHKVNIESSAFPLEETLGICSYTISPKGAKRFLNYCLPFRTYKRFHKGLKRQLDCVAVDDLMNDVYPNSKSYVAFPPLCLPSNDSSQAITGITRKDILNHKS